MNESLPLEPIWWRSQHGKLTRLETREQPLERLEQRVLHGQRGARELVEGGASRNGAVRIQVLAPGAQAICLVLPGLLWLEASGAQPVEAIEASGVQMADGVEGSGVHDSCCWTWAAPPSGGRGRPCSFQ